MSVTDKLKGLLGGDDEEQTESETDEVEVGESVTDIDSANKDLISPGFTDERRNRMLVGGQWTRTFFTSEWPDQPENQFLNGPFNRPQAHNDIAVHIEPKDSDAAVRELEQIRREIQRNLSGDSDFSVARDRQERLEKTKAIIDTLESTETELFDVGMYTTVRGSEDNLNQASQRVRDQLERAPALTDQQIPVYAQEDALKSVSPIAKDFMKENNNFDTRSEMMSGAIAAMLPFTSKTLIEPDGVEFGIQASNSSPVIVDRWGRSNGYNQLTIGEIGAGKSFNTKLNILRTYAAHEDAIIFMLDPLRGFTDICDHLNGETIPVGGGTTLNPLHITAPDDADKVIKEGGDPFGQKIKSVKGFIRSFYKSREKELGNEIEYIYSAIRHAYDRKNIEKDDLSTHNNESPTMMDVLDILEEMSNNPEGFTNTETDEELETIRTNAVKARRKLQEFEQGGELDYLSGQSEINLDSNDAVYLDLHQQEGSGNVGIMMQVLFEQVYQRAKETDKKVLFCIDEAHYIMDSADTLDFLAQAIRHSRHYDMSINFITQTAREFLEHDRAKDIADECVIKLLHKTEGLDFEAAQHLGLNEPEIEFVRGAQAGDDPDAEYSEALLGVEGEFMPIQVHASDIEEMLVTMGEEEIRKRL